MSIVGKDGWTPNLHMLQTMIMAEDPQAAMTYAMVILISQIL